jgi:hypothetical protein
MSEKNRQIENDERMSAPFDEAQDGRGRTGNPADRATFRKTVYRRCAQRVVGLFEVEQQEPVLQSRLLPIAIPGLLSTAHGFDLSAA